MGFFNMLIIFSITIMMTLSVMANPSSVEQLKSAMGGGNAEQPDEILSVVSIHYPPFTMRSIDGDNGLSYTLLRQALTGAHIKVKTLTYPPARAEKLIDSEQWCASFYPPTLASKREVLVGLSDQLVHLGLLRKRQNNRFRWQDLSELSGKKVAYFRGSLKPSGMGQAMLDANMSIFDVETIKQGVQLLIKGRVDYAFADNISTKAIFEQLDIDAQEYQFSETLLKDVQIGIWLNLECATARKAYQYLLSKGYVVVTPDNGR